MAHLDNPLIRRTLLLMALAAVALVGIVGMSLFLASRTSDHTEEVTRDREIRTAAGDLLSILQDMETGQRGFLLTREQAYLVPYEGARSRLAPGLSRLALAVAGSPEAGTFERLRSAAEVKAAELAETIQLASSGQLGSALQIVSTERGKEVMDLARRHLNQLVETSEIRVRARLQQLQSTSDALKWVSLSSAILILAAAGGAGWTVVRYTQDLVEAQHKVQATNASLEERVKDRTADLTQANEEIQRFAYIVSHDLRAPLVNILGFTSEMETSLKSLQELAAAAEAAEIDEQVTKPAKVAAVDDLPEAIGFIRASSAKMDRLINAILKLSREGRRELNPERVDLGAVLDAARASLQHQLAEADARIDINGRMPIIVSDRLALEQVFGNLTDNAVKYLAADRPGVIEVTAKDRLGWVSITVSDNGRGIAPADHERIFDLFRRAGAQDKSGEGIGLAHVRALVRRLGGEIKVASQLGQGSSFTVSLPKTLKG